MERQFRGVYERALRRRGVTGETMLQILETRLDNVVYHLGFANTRAAARQMVGHGHVKVNGRKVEHSVLRAEGERRDRGEGHATSRARWPPRTWKSPPAAPCPTGCR